MLSIPARKGRNCVYITRCPHLTFHLIAAERGAFFCKGFCFSGGQREHFSFIFLRKTSILCVCHYPCFLSPQLGHATHPGAGRVSSHPECPFHAQTSLPGVAGRRIEPWSTGGCSMDYNFPGGVFSLWAIVPNRMEGDTCRAFGKYHHGRADSVTL